MSIPGLPAGPDQPYDNRTKQEFAEDTDINRLLVKHQRAGTLSHLENHGGHYGDFSDMPDLLEAQSRLQRGQAIFDDLPAEIKREFGQSPARFFSYVNDPANADNLEQLLPGLAERGSQMPPARRTPANVDATLPNNPIASPEPPEAPSTDSAPTPEAPNPPES